MEDLHRQFSEIAAQYDGQRRYLIPCFDDFYTSCFPLLQRFAPFRRVLDIGAGTGLFSYFIYQQYPQASYTLTDLSAEMLSVAQKRFAGLDHFDFQVMDFSRDELPGGFDLVISGLAIHHLEDADKEALYGKVFRALNPGGLFVNADQVSGRTAGFDRVYKEHWRATIEASPLGREAVDKALERVKLDKFAPLELQLQMLTRAGFVETDCLYKSGNFVVFAAAKQQFG